MLYEACATAVCTHEVVKPGSDDNKPYRHHGDRGEFN